MECFIRNGIWFEVYLYIYFYIGKSGKNYLV